MCYNVHSLCIRGDGKVLQYACICGALMIVKITLNVIQCGRHTG